MKFSGKDCGELKVIHDGERQLQDASILWLSKLMVEGARDALWYAIDHLRRYPNLGGNWNDIVDVLAHHCFRYGAEDWPAEQDVDTMRRIFIRTLNGILGDQTILIRTFQKTKRPA
jgi:hypothetical protein